MSRWETGDTSHPSNYGLLTPSGPGACWVLLSRCTKRAGSERDSAGLGVTQPVKAWAVDPQPGAVLCRFVF